MTEEAFTGELEDRPALFMRVHHRTMHRYFQSAGMFNGHPNMLFHIAHTPGIPQKELAERLEIFPPSVAISIRRLEAARLVERQRDSRDGRVIRLFLTPEEKMDDACARGRSFLTDTVYEGLSPKEQQELYRLLGKMIENLQAACEQLLPREREGICE